MESKEDEIWKILTDLINYNITFRNALEMLIKINNGRNERANE